MSDRSVGGGFARAVIRVQSPLERRASRYEFMSQTPADRAIRWMQRDFIATGNHLLNVCPSSLTITCTAGA
jgi:hypothetical protein